MTRLQQAWVLLPGSAHAQNILDGDQKEPVERLILDRPAEFSDQ